MGDWNEALAAIIRGYSLPLSEALELEAHISALEAEARRYRWLREGCGDSGSPYVCGVHGAPMGDAGWLTGPHLDAAIDAAIKESAHED